MSLKLFTILLALLTGATAWAILALIAFCLLFLSWKIEDRRLDERYRR